MIKFKIDEKSLYYGVKNDYVRGQTATVSTPINQSNNPKKWRLDIMKLYETNLHSRSTPEQLINKCLNKTTSKAGSSLKYFYSFCDLKIDGEKLDAKFDFGMYIKEEIDEIIVNKKGEKVPNTHLGREKLHYPITLIHQSDGFNINNKSVLDQILVHNGGFAYIIRGFEINVSEKSLNFITTIIGPKDILLSSVFKKKKGIGTKLLTSFNINPIAPVDFDNETEEISPKFIEQSLTQKNLSMIENGKLGEEIAFDYINKLISEHPQTMKDLFHTSKSYAFSPYDMEFYENGVKKYIEVKATSSDKKVFNMSKGEIKFMEKYRSHYKIILITKVKDKFPNIYILTPDDIFKFKKEYPSIRFTE
jgi:hypothetical protein